MVFWNFTIVFDLNAPRWTQLSDTKKLHIHSILLSLIINPVTINQTQDIQKEHMRQKNLRQKKVCQLTWRKSNNSQIGANASYSREQVCRPMCWPHKVIQIRIKRKAVLYEFWQVWHDTKSDIWQKLIMRVVSLRMLKFQKYVK